MKTIKQKKESLKEISDKLSKSKITIFSSFAQQGQKGLNVSGMRELRKSLRPLDSEYSVEKKTLLDKALKDDKKKTDVFSYEGSIGVTYAYGDPFASAKALHQFSKKNPMMKLFGAWMGDEFIDSSRLLELANIPSREVLLGRLVGMLSYPMRGLAVALDQISKNKSN